ncbi:MAG: phosphopantothenoylcysteine decarboxylase [Candidatus Omnitrophota bacterium]
MILVTAGPTIEPLDPVRYLSNRSSGAMGYYIAGECASKGYKVCLISGPSNLTPPDGVEIIKAETAGDMERAVMERIDEADAIVMAAAVCDFRPEEEQGHKIKKERDGLVLKLVRNPDILAEIGLRKGLVKVGFALESRNAVENAANKLENKGLDFIVVNTVGEGMDPFGDDGKISGTERFLRYDILDKNGGLRQFEGITKRQMAGLIAEELDKWVK